MLKNKKFCRHLLNCNLELANYQSFLIILHRRHDRFHPCGDTSGTPQTILKTI